MIKRDSIFTPSPKTFKQPPSIVYLTIGENSESIYVTYHKSFNQPILPVRYKKTTELRWKDEQPETINFPNEARHICHTKLTDLDPDTDYEFYIGSTAVTHKFKTLPEDLSEPLIIGIGSDFHSGYDRLEPILELVGEKDCRLFALLGDFVDDDGRLNTSPRWVEFWNRVVPKLKDSKGRMIPLVSVIGNHEFTNSSSPNANEMETPFFHHMFPHLPKNPNYSVVDIGDDLSFLLLDNISGGEYMTSGNQKWKGVDADAQVTFVEQTILSKSDQAWVIPFYHTPLYPSHRNMPVRFNTQVNNYQLKELFAKYISLSFCGHDHVYKVTKPMVWDNGLNTTRPAISGEKGHVEMGDGGVGDKFYPGNLADSDYLEITQTDTSFVNIVNFEKDKATVQAYDHLKTLVNTTEIEN